MKFQLWTRNIANAKWGILGINFTCDISKFSTKCFRSFYILICSETMEWWFFTLASKGCNIDELAKNAFQKHKNENRKQAFKVLFVFCYICILVVIKNTVELKIKIHCISNFGVNQWKYCLQYLYCTYYIYIFFVCLYMLWIAFIKMWNAWNVLYFL